MFIAGVSNIQEPPVNDIWSVPGEEKMLKNWIKEDSDLFKKINPMEYFLQLQIEDFLNTILEEKKPLVTGEEGRATVEIFTAIYRSKRDRKAIKFPLNHEYDMTDF